MQLAQLTLCHSSKSRVSTSRCFFKKSTIGKLTSSREELTLWQSLPYRFSTVTRWQNLFICHMFVIRSQFVRYNIKFLEWIYWTEKHDNWSLNNMMKHIKIGVNIIISCVFSIWQFMLTVKLNSICFFKAECNKRRKVTIMNFCLQVTLRVFNNV